MWLMPLWWNAQTTEMRGAQRKTAWHGDLCISGCLPALEVRRLLQLCLGQWKQVSSRRDANECEEQCKWLHSASALSQIVQCKAELPLQPNCTAPRSCCGLVLSLSLLPCTSYHVLSPCISCQYPMPPSHELSYPTALMSLVKLYLFLGHSCKRVPLIHLTRFFKAGYIWFCDKITPMKIVIKDIPRKKNKLHACVSTEEK